MNHTHTHIHTHAHTHIQTHTHTQTKKGYKIIWKILFDVYNYNSFSNCELFIMSNNFKKLEKLRQAGDYIAMKITDNSGLSELIF